MDKLTAMDNGYFIQILGCGTSTGIPIPGCKCPVCTSENPKNTRMKTSAVVRAANGQRLLIDASTDLRHQALAHGLTRVDAVAFTHAHADHILGIEDLRPFNFLSGNSIPLYADPLTRTSIEKIFSYIFHPNPEYEGGSLAQLSLHELQHGAPCQMAGIEVLPFELFHGKLSVTGFRIGNLAYATDCNRIPEESMTLLEGVEVLILDALRYEPHRTHFTIPQAIEQARKIGAEKTYFVHMTHSVEYEAVNAQLPEGIELAYDGLLIPFQADAS